MNEQQKNIAPGAVVSQMSQPVTSMPKGAPLAPPSAAAKKPNSRLTFRQLLTENGAKEYLVPLLRELSLKKRKSGTWREYFDFYTANQSGDVDLMKPEVKTKVEKLIKALNDEYFAQQDL